MSDAIFNTIWAVMVMCQNHAIPGTGFSINGVESNPLDGSRIPPHSKWEKGFEQCEEVTQAYRKEQERRKKKEEDEREKQKQRAVDSTEAQEKNRIANALAAIAGKPYKPEDPPHSITLPHFMN